MAIEVRVDGAATLHRVAAKMRAEGNKDLAREMGEALSKATDPIRTKIRESAAQTMPREGGYEAAFSKSLRFRNARKTQGASATVTLTTYADGTSERRDIRALEAGNLRHPVAGSAQRRAGCQSLVRHLHPGRLPQARHQGRDGRGSEKNGVRHSGLRT
jgi:hypothetical protein